MENPWRRGGEVECFLAASGVANCGEGGGAVAIFCTRSVFPLRCVGEIVSRGQVPQSLPSPTIRLSRSLMAPQFHSPAISQSRSPTVSQSHSLAILQPRNFAVPQIQHSRNPAVLQACGPVVLEPCNLAALQSRIPAVSQSHSLAVPQSQSCSLAVSFIETYF